MTQAIAQGTLQRVRRVQAITAVWMSIEAALSLSAAWRARSLALLAFGGDSAIELASAFVVFWRFRTNAVSEQLERRTARIAGGLLFALAAYVIAASVIALRGFSEARPTRLGIGILLAAAVFMPLLERNGDSQPRQIALHSEQMPRSQHCAVICP